MSGTYVRKTWAHNPHQYAPKRYRRGCSYEAFIPDALANIELRMAGKLAAVISDAETGISRLNAGAHGHLAPLARLLLRTESIASSKVEGLQIDARSLARAEAKQNAGRRPGPQASEILASIDAMELAIERAVDARAIEISDLREIHRALMHEASPKIAGQVRSEQNWIGGNDYNPCGADFVPPPPELVDGLLSDLCGFSNNDELSPLVQAAIAHAQFELIHPFSDGNGRTGRALVQVILRRTGLAPGYVPPISVMLARHKETYIRGLGLFRDGDADGWLRIFADAAAAAAQLASSYLVRVTDLQERWRRTLRSTDAPPRSDAAAWAIIDALPAHPIITIKTAIAATSRTRPAVVHAIDQLSAAGILLPMTESERNRSWEAADLLELIVDLEGGVG
jgi:Fic family protein